MLVGLKMSYKTANDRLLVAYVSNNIDAMEKALADGANINFKVCCSIDND